MSYGYFPTPARSEPATLSGRSLSSTATISIPAPGFEVHALPARLRPTRSVPTSFPADRTLFQQRRAGVGLGLGLGLPMACFQPRPERPRMRRQADLGLGTPFTAIPTRSMRRRVAGSFPMSPTARSRSGGAGAVHGLGIGLAMHREHPHPAHEEDEAHPAITLTLADAFDSEGSEDAHADSEEDSAAPGPRYSFLPPGLSSPVPWPSSPVDESAPATLSMPAVSPTRTVRPMMFRRLASPALRAAADAPPPAPLSPSLSRFGTHRHFRGLDHGVGGAGDDDALLGEMELAMPSRSRTRVPRTTPPSAPRMTWVERFPNDRLYH